MPKSAADLERKVDQLENDIYDIHEILVDVTGKLVQHDQRFDRLDSRLDTHDQRFDRLESKVDKVLEILGGEAER